MTESVQRDLAPGLADLVDPYHPGEQECDRFGAIALDEDVCAGRDATEDAFALDLTFEIEICVFEGWKGLNQALVLVLVDHEIVSLYVAQCLSAP